MPPKFAGLETKVHPNLLTSIIFQYEDSVAGIWLKIFWHSHREHAAFGIDYNSQSLLLVVRNQHLDTCKLRILIHEIGRQLTVHAFCETSESQVTKKLLEIAKPHECTKLLIGICCQCDQIRPRVWTRSPWSKKKIATIQTGGDTVEILKLYAPIATKAISV